MVPLLLFYGGSVIGGWLRLILLVYTGVAGSVGR